MCIYREQGPTCIRQQMHDYNITRYHQFTTLFSCDYINVPIQCGNRGNTKSEHTSQHQEVVLHERWVSNSMHQIKAVAVNLAFSIGNECHILGFVSSKRNVLHDLQCCQDRLAKVCGESVVFVVQMQKEQWALAMERHPVVGGGRQGNGKCNFRHGFFFFELSCMKGERQVSAYLFKRSLVVV